MEAGEETRTYSQTMQHRTVRLGVMKKRALELIAKYAFDGEIPKETRESLYPDPNTPFWLLRINTGRITAHVYDIEEETAIAQNVIKVLARYENDLRFHRQLESEGKEQVLFPKAGEEASAKNEVLGIAWFVTKYMHI